jgi:CSLREA domain-containing protein
MDSYGVSSVGMARVTVCHGTATPHLGGAAMKSFARRVYELTALYSDRLIDSAIAALRGYSSARTSIKFLLGIPLLMVPLGILTSRSLLHAIPPSIIIVTSLDDPAETSGNGFCTLREAIDNANSVGTDTTGGDCDVAVSSPVQITFLFSGTIILSSALPQIASPLNLTIQGFGSPYYIIDGASLYQVLNVASGATLTLTGLTIQHGFAQDGGGVTNAGTLIVSGCSFLDNTSPNSGDSGGGAIYNQGSLTVNQGSVFSNNVSDGGGAILSHGTSLSVDSSTFSSNETQVGAGGAIVDLAADSPSITNSTFTGNSAPTEGGRCTSISAGRLAPAHLPITCRRPLTLPITAAERSM